MGNSNIGKEELHRVLQTKTLSADDCDAYLPLLHDYVEAQIAGADYLAQFVDVALHLDSCLACADAYARLYELELALIQNALPVVASIPEPDLSFLEASSPVSTPSLVDLLADLLTQTAETIRFRLTEELLMLLQPPQSATVVRAADDARYQELLYELQPEQLPASAVPMQMSVYRDAEQEEKCLLEVTITPPGESWPALGGRTVQLQLGEERQSATTDAWGVAAFEDILIEQLDSVEITFRQ